MITIVAKQWLRCNKEEHERKFLVSQRLSFKAYNMSPPRARIQFENYKKNKKLRFSYEATRYGRHSS